MSVLEKLHALGLTRADIAELRRLLGTGVYSDVEIIEGYARGDLTIYPFDPRSVNSSSYDVRLGEFFFDCEVRRDVPFYNWTNADDVTRYFGGRQARRGIPLGQFFDDHPECRPEDEATYLHLVDTPVIPLGPLQRILAHTNEFIGSRVGTTEMRARSSTGRNGLGACLCAGWGDRGYCTRWTMEVINFNHCWTFIPVGFRIAQIIFYWLGQSAVEYGLGGKYQAGTSLEAFVANWTPEMMLPKSFNDPVERLVQATSAEAGALVDQLATTRQDPDQFDLLVAQITHQRQQGHGKAAA